MCRKYKFRNPDGVYFITFSVIGWIDIFTRNEYREIVVDSINWCIKNKGLVVHAWVIMSNHVHMIISRDGSTTLDAILRDIKKFTSVKLIEEIKINPEESRKQWMLQLFNEAGISNTQNIIYQFWQHGNHPIELDNNMILEQKLEYLHHNPVKQGFTNRQECYPWSSAKDYAGEKGMIELEFL